MAAKNERATNARVTHERAKQDRTAEQEATGSGYPPEVARFVERFAAELTEAGMQRMAARTFSCLLVSESGALSSAELGERLRVSPAAVSGAVRYLAHVRLVNREREPGSRRELYRIHPDVWYQSMHQRDAYMARFVSTFEEGLDVLGPDTPAGQRIAESIEFFRFMERELAAMLDRWRAHRESLYGRPSERDGAE